jgi:multimeric flavodoxin WrbA/putative sterol carrier protein
MKVLLVRAAPRKEGMTNYITDIMKKGIIDAGGVITEIDLSAKKIIPCCGCYDCWTVSPGVCRYNDDMEEILSQILECDMLLCSTPLYHYSMNAELLKFFERTFPLSEQGFIDTDYGIMRNKIRYPEKWNNKKLGFIAACGMRSARNFDGMIKSFEMIATGENFNLVSKLIRPESFLLPYKYAKPRTIKKIEHAIERAGSELVLNGFVSDKTTDIVKTPISSSLENMIKHTNIFWEHVFGSKGSGLDQKAAQERMLHDVRVLMREMVSYVDPIATKRVKATIQFVFPDRDLNYIITINRGEATLEEGEAEKFDLKLTVDESVWAAMFLREISPMDAIMQKKIIMEGEKSLFTKFDKYFPAPRG